MPSELVGVADRTGGLFVPSKARHPAQRAPGRPDLQNYPQGTPSERTLLAHEWRTPVAHPR